MASFCRWWKTFMGAFLLLHQVDMICCDVNAMAMTQILPPLCKTHKDKVPHFKINTASLKVENDLNMGREVLLYAQSEQCYKCDLLPIARVHKDCIVRIDSRWSTRIELRAIDNGTILNGSLSCNQANLSQHFQEGGIYTIYTSRGNDYSPFTMGCIMVLENNPSDPNIPIYVAIGLALFMIIFCTFCYYCYRRGYVHRFIFFWSTENMMSDLGPTNNINHIDDGSEQSSPAVVKERLKSLDTFRGLAIVIMIFVNYGGGKYWFFKHSKWNGLTVADLVFPWFIFIMGTAMVFSIRGQVIRSIPKWKIFSNILRRSASLFFLGLIINSRGKDDGVDLSSFRIPGVLQRFAGTYLITGSIYLFLSFHHPPNPHSRLAAVQDLTYSALEWVAQLILVFVHLIVTLAVSYPGCPAGYLGPGGLEDGGKYFNCTGGIAGYVDRQFFGDAHIYGSPTSTEIYHQTVPYDPEGLLGTLNSCFMCFLGLQAGKIIKMHTDWVKRCQRFLIWAVVLAAIGTILCKASLNDGWIPINKNLWSLSFVLILSGMAFFLLMICYVSIDVYKVWSGTPFYYAGMNSIALYVGHEFFSRRFPVNFSVPQTHGAQLALDLWGAVFWVIVAAYLHYKEIFVSV